MIMQIFVAGATGVLGRRVVPELLSRGHRVRAVARSDAKAAMLRGQGAEPVSVDLFDAAAVGTAVAGSETVLNLATAIPPTRRMLSPSAWRMTNRLRTDAARNLVDAALATGAARYVQEALAFVYADHGAAWIDEDATFDLPAQFDGVRAAEAETRRFGSAGGQGVVLRFGLFYSADSPQTRDLLDLVRRGWLLMPGRAEGYQSWVHVDDAAAAVVAALDVPGGAYHVVEDDPLPNAAHLEVLAGLVGRRVRQPAAWLAVGPLRLQARSLRVSNARLRAVSAWRPAFPSRREGLAKVVEDLGADPGREPSHV
jgi:nucleoside-diphosphate-sugar epimerase